MSNAPDILIGIGDEQHDDDRHSYTFVTESGKPIARFEIDNLHEHSHQPHGELTVWYLFDGQEEELISYKRLNLVTSSEPGKNELLNPRADWVPWEKMYEKAKSLTIKSERRPDPPKTMSKPDEVTYPPFLIEPFILDRGVSLMFGPGGTGKSMLALAMSVAVASGRPMFGRQPEETGPVLYIDYEEPDKDPHERRLNALLEGLGLEWDDLTHDIHWVKPKRSLVKSGREIATYMEQIRPRLVVVDSVAKARGGDAYSPDATLNLFDALGRMQCSVFCIDHVAKEEMKSRKLASPFGSIFTMNSVRLAWSVIAAEASSNDITYLNLNQIKRNHVAAHEPMGGEIRYTSEMVQFNHSVQPVLREVVVNTLDMWWEMEEGSVGDRGEQYIAEHGATPNQVLARELGVSPDTMRISMSRRPNVVKVKQGNIILWSVPND